MRTIGAIGAIGLVLLLGACFGSGDEGTDTARSSAPAGPSGASAEPTDEAREALPVVSYTPEDFPFITVIPDDGHGRGGGWQKATANLTFRRWVIPHPLRRWECSLTIEMPLRTEVAGPIPPRHAATLSAQIAAEVARAMDPEYDLPPGIFCFRFVKRVDALFKLKYPLLGTRVTP
jgi:hypothetical protein